MTSVGASVLLEEAQHEEPVREQAVELAAFVGLDVPAPAPSELSVEERAWLPAGSEVEACQQGQELLDAAW